LFGGRSKLTPERLLLLWLLAWPLTLLPLLELLLARLLPPFELFGDPLPSLRGFWLPRNMRESAPEVDVFVDCLLLLVAEAPLSGLWFSPSIRVRESEVNFLVV